MNKPFLARSVTLVVAALLLTACASSPPKNPDDLCDVFEEKRDWYKASKDASDRWGAPIQVPMAIMYQESAFKAKAQPPMRWFLGFIPYGRASSAYGYSQAKKVHGAIISVKPVMAGLIVMILKMRLILCSGISIKPKN